MAEPRGKALREGEEPPGGAAAASEAWRKGEEEAETEGGKEEGVSVWWSIEWLPKSGGSTRGDAPVSRSAPSRLGNFTQASPPLPGPPLPFGAFPLRFNFPAAISCGFLRVILFFRHLAI